MKILNLKTNNIFNLPDSEAKKLLKDYPEDFSKNIKSTKSKNLKKDVSASKVSIDKESILSQIIE